MFTKQFWQLLFMFLFCAANIFAQDAEKNPPIQDNSFLIEEAYNQEAGVIQHINTFTRSRNDDWLYTFTKEIPIPNQKHQLSFILPVQKISGFPGSETGIGDVAINYRYQLVAKKKQPSRRVFRFCFQQEISEKKEARAASVSNLICPSASNFPATSSRIQMPVSRSRREPKAFLANGRERLITISVKASCGWQHRVSMC
jgi:hypothetical protein